MPDIHMQTARGGLPDVHMKTYKDTPLSDDIRMETAKGQTTVRNSKLKVWEKQLIETPEVKRKATAAQLCKSPALRRLVFWNLSEHWIYDQISWTTTSRRSVISLLAKSVGPDLIKTQIPVNFHLQNTGRNSNPTVGENEYCFAGGGLNSEWRTFILLPRLGKVAMARFS